MKCQTMLFSFPMTFRYQTHDLPQHTIQYPTTSQRLQSQIAIRIISIIYSNHIPMFLTWFPMSNRNMRQAHAQGARRHVQCHQHHLDRDWHLHNVHVFHDDAEHHHWNKHRGRRKTLRCLGYVCVCVSTYMYYIYIYVYIYTYIHMIYLFIL